MNTLNLYKNYEQNINTYNNTSADDTYTIYSDDEYNVSIKNFEVLDILEVTPLERTNGRYITRYNVTFWSVLYVKNCKDDEEYMYDIVLQNTVSKYDDWSKNALDFYFDHEDATDELFYYNGEYKIEDNKKLMDIIKVYALGSIDGHPTDLLEHFFGYDYNDEYDYDTYNFLMSEQYYTDSNDLYEDYEDEDDEGNRTYFEDYKFEDE